MKLSRLPDIRKVVYGLLPRMYTDIIAERAGYSRFKGYENLTATLIIAYLLLLTAGTALIQIPMTYRVITFIVIAPGALFLPYALFTILAEQRRKSIEQVLPDALLLMSANIESGLTVDKAFLLSARDEFGPLATDIRQTAMKMFGGTPVEDALRELAEDTNSELFEETLKLLIDGIDAGAQVSNLLESSANDIRNSLHLREEIAASVQTYSMFIMIAALVGAPILFSISVFLTQATQNLWSAQNLNAENLPETGMLTLSQPSIDPSFFAQFSLAAIIISNFFAALVISEIKNGRATDGLKRAPVFVVIAVVIFFASRLLVSTALGGFF